MAKVGLMLKRILHLGFLTVLAAAILPGSAKAWDDCYYHCYPRYNYYHRDYSYGYRPYYYPRYYTGCRWCGGYDGYDGYGDGYYPYGGYRGYRRHYSFFRYEEWDSYDW